MKKKWVSMALSWTLVLGLLGAHASDKPEEILKAVRRDVDAFVGDAPQFDDLTMLAFERK